MSTTEPRAFTTVYVLNCSVNDCLYQKRTALTTKKGCENIQYCFHSMVGLYDKDELRSQTSFDSSVTKRKKEAVT